MLKDALIRNRLRGIRFKEVDLHLAYQFFADNTNAILEAGRGNINMCI